ncbi:uncharacterized protein LOC143427114 [Xylocopa sonorina]|uniref:uncharacterized protein LOC143427114 n=1 Tax=Xylocopa sonorina TaxID=1818115 RepID=UPI00403B2EAE
MVICTSSTSYLMILLICYSSYFERHNTYQAQYYRVSAFAKKLLSFVRERSGWFLEDRDMTCSHHTFFKLGGQTYVIAQKNDQSPFGRVLPVFWESRYVGW